MKDFLRDNKINFVGLIETRVQKNVAKKLSSEIEHSFRWLDNYDNHHGGRIWVGWDPFLWDVSVLAQSSQHITCSAFQKHLKTDFIISFVYGLNTGTERKQLWSDLLDVGRMVGQSAWILSGDFNVCFDVSEKHGGRVCWNNDMGDFRDCILSLGLTDLRFNGDLFTWCDGNIQSPVYRKLDRVMVNANWLVKFDLSSASFLNKGLSDHCPAATDLGVARTFRPKPFKCFNFLCEHPLFLETVSRCWNSEIRGDPWFILTSKLKSVKTGLKDLNRRVGNIHSRVEHSRAALTSFQSLQSFPSSPSDFEREQDLISAYKSALFDEECFLKQKSRVQWLKLGDNNSRYFFNSCKNRWNANKILALSDSFGVVHDSHEAISSVAVNYFKDLFGTSSPVSHIPEDLQLPCLTHAQSVFLSRPFSNDEILKTLKSMPKNKSPGPDGFTSEFFIKAWSIVGSDVVTAISHFFQTCHMPRIINSAAVALVPKIKNPSKMQDFRPISCCNTLYKCVSRMISRRMKHVLNSFISPFQSAFLPGRSIGDNVLLVQSLCKDYHRPMSPPRCAIKVDIHKAFDSLNWDFIFEALRRMNFPPVFVNWVYACISGAMFSININGSLEGYFKGNSGLRQGDPLSPYLFVLAMEVFSACLIKSTVVESFHYHWRTKDIKLNHLIFADDVFLFCRGDVGSAEALLEGLNLFSSISGLHPNKNKCQCFFAGIHPDVEQQILGISDFKQGSFPITYLGLPLITSRLSARDCQPLIDRLCARIEVWTARFLSFAGRLALIHAILNGILGYWSMFLFLPNFILTRINSLFFKFLWGGYYKQNGRCHYKVSWIDCCLPKAEGGLGLRNIFHWNHSAALFQLWRIIQPNANSIWITWFNEVLFKNKGIWTGSIPYRCSWGVRHILNCRTFAKHFIKYHVGLQSNFHFWLDPWVQNSPLLLRFDAQAISNSESSQSALVSHYQQDGAWVLPTSNHYSVQEIRRLVSRVQLHDSDHITWDGIRSHNVSISTIWNSFRQTSSPSPWYDVVWNSFSIPKCSFILWTALKNRLLTRDRMLDFQMQTPAGCLFCNDIESTHHIFTDCPFFGLIRRACPVAFSHDWAQCQLGNIFNHNLDNRHKLIGSLYFSVAVYLVWKERNFRCHNSGHAHASLHIILKIKQMVREKLFSCEKFKKWVREDNSIISIIY